MAGRRLRWPRPIIVLAAIGALAVIGHTDSGTAADLVAVAWLPGAKSVEAPCRDRDDCGSPLKGGLRITFTGWACTAGFAARATSDLEWYVVTAGHCLTGSGLYARWSHHGAIIGRAALDAFGDRSGVDAGAIEVSADSASNELYGRDQDDIRRVTAIVPDRAQSLGTAVCRSGGTSGWSCGRVARQDIPIHLLGVPVAHTWWTDFPSATGDSGSPVIDRGGRLLGITIATTPTQTIYVTAEDVLAALRVQPCLQEDCRTSR